MSYLGGYGGYGGYGGPGRPAGPSETPPLLADPVALLLSSDGTVDAMDVHRELPWKQAPIENAMQLHLFR